ncbi:endonuclease domain-containing protein [Hyphomicrobium sp. DY-1]|uniref:endonuclease domain-containing protein n=1 Tax=Hyphomicrobium sp. DY-1 TaxID=3075650 RepID=UPI0039C28FC6
MIKDRPQALLADPAYCTLPKPPLRVDWSSVPELIRAAMQDLGGIQPVTKAMAEAAGGKLRDKPSDGEVALFKKRGAQFQMISVVLSVVAAGVSEGALNVKPFAVTLIPGSKRGEISHDGIEFVSKVDVAKWLKTEPSYTGYDPFSGDWSLYGNIPGYLDGKRKGFLDEIGIVVDQFFLATELADDDEVLTMNLQMPSQKMTEKYEKHRNRLLFTPFQEVEARRVWGAETPIELFLLQALAKEGLFPQSQMLIMDDGVTFPSWYHLWSDIEFRHSRGLVTEADFFFETERIAVFCDGAHHARKKQREKDTAINQKLEALGIQAVRIPGSEINFDLPKAVSRVTEALKAADKKQPVARDAKAEAS